MNFDWKKRIAIVTGGRVKIGFNIAIKLLSYNCIVLITTRFPKDALIRFQSHPDYQKWKNNLFIYPIDFRIIESTVKFIEYIEKNFTHIDILINNAAQTIRRKTEYYKYLLSIESKKLNDENIIIKNEKYQLLPIKNSNLISNELIDQSLIKNEQNNINLNKEIFPLSVIASQIKIMEEKYQPTKTILDYNGQPYDFSKEKNSWQLEIDEISFTEFFEVQIINTWTPYYLNVKLKPLLEKSPFQDKYIVNVTSVEGIFSCFKKSTHPHTNMAKAALNMMTRTCGSYYKNKQIYMTSVDTGWISPMNDVGYFFKNEDNFEEEFKNLPLDELDGAMRVLHPIIQGIQHKEFLYGILLKDYKKCNW
jgi:NAD(P)-dependent dehydrogenase (short-subunit alcohol dehydrogenase family)